MKRHFGICKKCDKEYSKLRPLRSEFCSKTCHNTFTIKSICKLCEHVFEYGLCRKSNFIINEKHFTRSEICHKCVESNFMKSYKDKYRTDINTYYRNKRITNKSFAISMNLRTRISKAINDQNAYKSDFTKNLLGCSIEELKQYLESQFYLNKETKEMMAWNNYGYYGWHIDHIKPCVSFDLIIPEQQQICFHYTNLQPLWWKDNLSKGDK